MNMKSNLLQKVGLSPLEADIYLLLLRSPTLTGYRIAQRLGKPVPNTYQALESLCKKGAVLRGPGQKAVYSAQPIEQYLDLLEKDFAQTRVRIQDTFLEPDPPSIGLSIYTLEQPEQVRVKAQEMLQTARACVLCDITPDLLASLQETFIRTAARKIRTHVLAYEHADLGKCDVTVNRTGSPVNIWPAGWIHMACDGKESITAILAKSDGRIIQAVWNNSLFLSLIHHNGLMAEIMLSKLKNDQKRKYMLLESVLESFDPLRTQKLAIQNGLFGAAGH